MKKISSTFLRFTFVDVLDIDDASKKVLVDISWLRYFKTNKREEQNEPEII